MLKPGPSIVAEALVSRAFLRIGAAVIRGIPTMQ
jgi:hypothetical protein